MYKKPTVTVRSTAATESANKLPITATGAFLQERSRDPAFGGKFNPALDNPGRIPVGLYFDRIQRKWYGITISGREVGKRMQVGRWEVKIVDDRVARIQYFHRILCVERFCGWLTWLAELASRLSATTAIKYRPIQDWWARSIKYKHLYGTALLLLLLLHL